MANVYSLIDPHLLPELAALSEVYTQEPFPNIKAFLLKNIGRYPPTGRHDLDAEARYVYESLEPHGPEYLRLATLFDLPEYRLEIEEDDVQNELSNQAKQVFLQVSDQPLWGDFDDVQPSAPRNYYYETVSELVQGLEKAFTTDYSLWHPKDVDKEAEWIAGYRQRGPPVE